MYYIAYRTMIFSERANSKKSGLIAGCFVQSSEGVNVISDDDIPDYIRLGNTTPMGRGDRFLHK